MHLFFVSSGVLQIEFFLVSRGKQSGSPRPVRLLRDRGQLARPAHGAAQASSPFSSTVSHRDLARYKLLAVLGTNRVPLPPYPYDHHHYHLSDCQQRQGLALCAGQTEPQNRLKAGKGSSRDCKNIDDRCYRIGRIWKWKEKRREVREEGRRSTRHFGE